MTSGIEQQTQLIIAGVHELQMAGAPCGSRVAGADARECGGASPGPESLFDTLCVVPAARGTLL